MSPRYLTRRRSVGRRLFEGTLVRNGPGQFEAGPHSFQHLFDGLALLSKFRVAPGGRVFASTRFVQSRDHAAAQGEGGYIRSRQFGTQDTPRGPLAWASGVLGNITGADVTDNANVSVIPWPAAPGGALACTETVAGTFSLDVGSLETSPFVWGPDSVKGSLTTAHALPGPNGDLLK